MKCLSQAMDELFKWNGKEKKYINRWLSWNERQDKGFSTAGQLYSTLLKLMKDGWKDVWNEHISAFLFKDLRAPHSLPREKSLTITNNILVLFCKTSRPLFLVQKCTEANFIQVVNEISTYRIPYSTINHYGRWIAWEALKLSLWHWSINQTWERSRVETVCYELYFTLRWFYFAFPLQRRGLIIYVFYIFYLTNHFKSSFYPDQRRNVSLQVK